MCSRPTGGTALCAINPAGSAGGAHAARWWPEARLLRLLRCRHRPRDVQRASRHAVDGRLGRHGTRGSRAQIGERQRQNKSCCVCAFQAVPSSRPSGARASPRAAPERCPERRRIGMIMKSERQGKRPPHAPKVFPQTDSRFPQTSRCVSMAITVDALSCALATNPPWRRPRRRPRPCCLPRPPQCTARVHQPLPHRPNSAASPRMHAHADNPCSGAAHTSNSMGRSELRSGDDHLRRTVLDVPPQPPHARTHNLLPSRLALPANHAHTPPPYDLAWRCHLLRVLSLPSAGPFTPDHSVTRRCMKSNKCGTRRAKSDIPPQTTPQHRTFEGAWGQVGATAPPRVSRGASRLSACARAGAVCERRCAGDDTSATLPRGCAKSWAVVDRLPRIRRVRLAGKEGEGRASDQRSGGRVGLKSSGAVMWS